MPLVQLMSQKMGIHEWSYDNDDVAGRALQGAVVGSGEEARQHQQPRSSSASMSRPRSRKPQRCLNCDVQTVFMRDKCIECDACVDICPMDCITFTANGDEAELRTRLTAPALNLTQDLYVSEPLKTLRVMVKDEDVCLHCGLCAERCPTGAWDMQKFLLLETYAGSGCRSKRAREVA